MVAGERCRNADDECVRFLRAGKIRSDIEQFPAAGVLDRFGVDVLDVTFPVE